MKNKYVYLIKLCLLIMIYSCASYGPKNKNLSLVLSKTQQAIGNLEEKITITDDNDLKAAYNELTEKSAVLFPVLENCNDKYALTPEYVATLEATENTLRKLNEEFEIMNNKTFVLNAVSKDYEAKLQTIKNTAQNNATTTIKVMVNSSENDGFFVFGKLSYEQDLDIKRFRFNQPTQNASLDFVPGYYLFWLEKDGLIGEPELHLIMSNGGEEEKQLVLKTPK
ncbi:hypothetical protein SAMN04487910_1536 [Aquimarina amphilecti]|uniref:Uncharacterized protein n=1 Tax=Aquimarina amphilecti TaxID=1038014 RepID=A0A1H7L5Z8_AQUAM|nr:hypothetical protein [Aquimarina amphilecti]SEK94388.1 hypothetical protein SAMN04487910_1536 [Aquimarina amphilecti]